MVRVYVAQKRKITEGDKLAGRHGNKGVIAKILPIEDMPFLEDGTRSMSCSTRWVPRRMNLGQILETHLGWVAKSGWMSRPTTRVLSGCPRALSAPPGTNVATPVFDGAREDALSALLEHARPDEDGTVLVDATGKPALRRSLWGALSGPQSVGYIYILKLLHLVDDKIHARSTGPYSMITQQPLGGKAQFGGQRFRRDGGVGPRGVRRCLRPAGTPHHQVR